MARAGDGGLLACLLLMFACSTATAVAVSSYSGEGSLTTVDGVREFLAREEDTIIFCLIERAKYSWNPDSHSPRQQFPVVVGPPRDPATAFRGNLSLAEIVVRDLESADAKAGRFRDSKEIPFFAAHEPYSSDGDNDLHVAGAAVNADEAILRIYFEKLLPMFASSSGKEANSAVVGSSDLACLQALARRINFGRFVAETKFKSTPDDFLPAIVAHDKAALMKLVTSAAQEETVVRRVEKKARVLAQDITLDYPADDGSGDGSDFATRYKIDPFAASRLYEEWVIPLTKEVEVEYLIRRLS